MVTVVVAQERIPEREEQMLKRCEPSQANFLDEDFSVGGRMR